MPRPPDFSDVLLVEVLGGVRAARDFGIPECPVFKGIWRIPLNIDFPISRIDAARAAITVWVARTVGIRICGVGRFVFCKVRNVVGRMGLGCGFEPHSGHYSVNV